VAKILVVVRFDRCRKTTCAFSDS